MLCNFDCNLAWRSAAQIGAKLCASLEQLFFRCTQGLFVHVSSKVTQMFNLSIWTQHNILSSSSRLCCSLARQESRCPQCSAMACQSTPGPSQMLCRARQASCHWSCCCHALRRWHFNKMTVVARLSCVSSAGPGSAADCENRAAAARPLAAAIDIFIARPAAKQRQKSSAVCNDAGIVNYRA
jgi:hypothetical protein